MIGRRAVNYNWSVSTQTRFINPNRFVIQTVLQPEINNPKLNQIMKPSQPKLNPLNWTKTIFWPIWVELLNPDCKPKTLMPTPCSLNTLWIALYISATFNQIQDFACLYLFYMLFHQINNWKKWYTLWCWDFKEELKKKVYMNEIKDRSICTIILNLFKFLPL